MIGLDTTAIIDMFKGDINLKKVIEELNDVFGLTIINYQEIMFGIDKDNPKHKIEEEFYDALISRIFFFNMDIKSSKKAAEIFYDLKRKGFDIGQFDCMIASIFLMNGVNKIITRNVKHFINIPGLKVISY